MTAGPAGETSAASGDPLHGTVLVLGTRGVLLLGDSGTGKTTLALDLLARWRGRGRFAALVADDRATVVTSGGRAVASAPPAIAGLAELAGHGIVRPRAVPAAVLELAATLRPDGEIERIPPSLPPFVVAGARLRHVLLPARSARAAALLEAALAADPGPDGGAGPVRDRRARAPEGPV